MANNAAGLNAIIDLALRDPSDETWTSAEKDAAIARAVRNLSPKVVRPLAWSDTANSDTLVASTYYYSLASTMFYLSRIDMVESDATERGPLPDEAWELTGDISLGAGVVHIAPWFVQKWAGSVIWYRGYGVYDVTTNLIPDEYVDLVIAAASAELVRALLADRSRFLQTGVTRQDQIISVTEMVTMLNAFEQVAREKKAATTTFRKPVPGRRG